MFAHTRSFFFLSVLMLCNSAAIASVTGQTFNVSVGGNGDTFSPKTLTIQVGDTVTWTNAGGFHNVDATDGSFRNGNPSSSTWTFSHTFTAAGTVNYQCDTHVAMGMTGSITVQAVTPPPPSKNLSATLTGQWYNPAQSGHGFLFEFTNVPDDAIPSQNELVV